jgi:hypothetical protein
MGLQFFSFKNLNGFAGYNSNPPVMMCDFSRQGNVFVSIYQKVVNVSNLLQKVRNCLIQYNNIVIGNGNNVNGSNNLIIGS